MLDPSGQQPKQPERYGVYPIQAINEVEDALRNTYWDSEEFTRSIEAAADDVAAVVLRAINTDESLEDSLENRSFSTDDVYLITMASKAVHGGIHQPYVYGSYFEAVRSRIFQELPQTTPVPVENGHYGAPTNVRIAWNLHGKAYFVHESEEVGLSRDRREYPGNPGSCWVEPNLTVSRRQFDDGKGLLQALTGLKGDQNDAIRRAASQDLKRMAKQQKDYYKLSPSERDQYGTIELMGELYVRPLPPDHEVVSAAIFDTDRLHEIEVRRYGLGRLAT